MSDTPTATTGHQKPRETALLYYNRAKKHFVRKHNYIRAFEDADLLRVATALRQCRETLSLVCCKACHHSWYVVTRCHQRICPLCSYEVTIERAKFINAMTKSMKHPKLVTLTMPLWTHDPHIGIKLLRKYFSQLRKEKCMASVKGGAYQIELKQKEGGWHIHIHAIVDAPYIPYQLLFKSWKRITGANAPQTDIRAADSPEARSYVAKYAAKSAALDTHPESIVAWYLATKGERLFATFGSFYNATINSLETQIDKPEFVPGCPHCGVQGQCFHARDGPFIFGRDCWQDVKASFLKDDDATIPLTEITSEVYVALGNKGHYITA